MIKNLITYLLIICIYPIIGLAIDAPNDSLINSTPAEQESLEFTISESLDPRDLSLPSCAYNHPVVKDCEFTMCKSRTPFGDIYVKVQNLPDNKCHYIERVPGLGGLNCTFERKELKDLHHLFTIRFQRLAGLSVIMTDNDFTTLGAIFTNKCIHKGDYLLNKQVQVSANPANFFDPEFKFSDITKYVTNYLAEHSIKKENVNQEYIATLNNYRSVFLNNEEVNSINQSRQKLPPIKENKGTLIIPDFNQFHMSSIKYKSPQDWSVRINGVEYTNASTENYIIFENVTPELVRLKWVINNLDKISPNWAANLMAVGKGKFISPKYSISVQTNQASTTISLTLKLNQAFDVVNMKILDKSKS